jgi:hypothetical protein
VKELPQLSGEWIGRYTGHYDEVVRVSQRGNQAEAVKVTGDDHVPAGEVTWRVDLTTMRGEGQIADREFRNPRFIPGRLVIHLRIESSSSRSALTIESRLEPSFSRTRTARLPRRRCSTARTREAGTRNAGEPINAKEAQVVWHGDNPVSCAARIQLRLPRIFSDSR